MHAQSVMQVKHKASGALEAFKAAEVLAHAGTPCKLYKECGAWFVEWEAVANA